MIVDDAEAIELELPCDAWPGFEIIRDGIEYVSFCPDPLNSDRIKWIRK